MPSVEDILIFAGADVGSGVGVDEIFVDTGAGVSEGTGAGVFVGRIVVALVP